MRCLAVKVRVRGQAAGTGGDTCHLRCQVMHKEPAGYSIA